MCEPRTNELAACKALARFLNVEQHAIAATVSQKGRSTVVLLLTITLLRGTHHSVPHLHLLVVLLLVVKIRPGLERVDTI